MACKGLRRCVYGDRLPLYSTKTMLCGYALARSFSSTDLLYKKQMPPRPKVDENDIEEKFLKGSGPGGQKTHMKQKNKTSSAVQLRHIPTGIVVKSQETRSREQNRKIARQILASKLEDIEKGDQSRNNVINEVKKKRKASKRKKSLRKYRKLDETKAGTAGQIAAGDEVSSGIAGELEAGEEQDCDDEDEDEDEDGFEECDSDSDEEEGKPNGDEDSEEVPPNTQYQNERDVMDKLLPK